MTRHNQQSRIRRTRQHQSRIGEPSVWISNIPQAVLTCSVLPCMRVRLLSFKILMVRAVVELSEWRYLRVKSGARAFQPSGSILVAAWIGFDTSSTAMSSKPIVVWMVWRRAATASCWERRSGEESGRRAGRVEIRESACNVILVITIILVLLTEFRGLW